MVLTPAKKWNLLVVPHVHVDVGYSDYQEKVAEIQSRELDEAMELIHAHPDFRFSPDGYWSVRQYLAGRSEEQQKQLFQMVKDKKIFVPTVEASLLTGFPALETLIRSLYPAFEFNQKYGGDADYANITDVPSYSWSYASVMAAAGLKYFVSGCDNDNGPILLYSRLNEKSPFWWEGPDGGRILMWYSWVYSQLAVLFGGLQGEIAAGHDSIPVFLQAYSRPEYKSDAVLVYGTQWENTDLFPRQASLADDWNKIYAYPHLQYSGFADAMEQHRAAIRRCHSGGAGRRGTVLGIRHCFNRPLRRHRTRDGTASPCGGEVFHPQQSGQSAFDARGRSPETALEQHGSLRRAHLGSRPQRVGSEEPGNGEPVGGQGSFCHRCEAGR